MVPYSAVDIVNAMNARYTGMGNGRRSRHWGRRLRHTATAFAAVVPWLTAGTLYLS